jgi:hypothetical protein
MSSARLEVLIWVLIFGGLLTVGLGLSVWRSDEALGWGLVAGGALAVAAGGVLVWVRSRRKDGDDR